MSGEAARGLFGGNKNTLLIPCESRLLQTPAVVEFAKEIWSSCIFLTGSPGVYNLCRLYAPSLLCPFKSSRVEINTMRQISRSTSRTYPTNKIQCSHPFPQLLLTCTSGQMMEFVSTGGSYFSPPCSSHPSHPFKQQGPVAGS